MGRKIKGGRKHEKKRERKKGPRGINIHTDGVITWQP